MKISVCMASYNGERFILEQLTSILSQLGKDDELIIVDDASHDSTSAIIAEIGDRRIKMLRNPTNKGIVASFEIALRNATGEIIFLSDQDDIWSPLKVNKVLTVFETFPDATLVITDVSLIDGGGNLLLQSRQTKQPFRSGLLPNLVKNGYTGCAMAFRRAVLEYALPFPSSVPMHDMWIGTLNEMYGKTMFYNEPLVLYRRHGSNASPEQKGTIYQMICWRIDLIVNLILRRFNVR